MNPKLQPFLQLSYARSSTESINPSRQNLNSAEKAEGGEAQQLQVSHSREVPAAPRGMSPRLRTTGAATRRFAVRS